MSLRDFLGCISCHWKLKLWLFGAIMAAYWGGYFLLERVSHASLIRMPKLAIDLTIPFEPGAGFIYLSQFVAMPLVIWLMSSRRQILACCRGLSLLIGVSFVIFYFWPTCVDRPEIAPGRYFFFDLIVGADLPRNACPSMHAAFAMFTAGCGWETFRTWTRGHWLIGGTWLWSAAIIVSTLLVKQHVCLDLFAGSVLGGFSWWFAGSLPSRVRPRVNA